jgi:NADH-quinone oxidoreductase E subunit
MGSHSKGVPAPDHGPVDWSAEDKVKIDEIFQRYPERRAGLLPVLWLAQQKWGWLSESVIRRVGLTMGLPPSDVLAVASFYTMFKKEPTGRYVLQVCHTLSCALRGADQIVSYLEGKLQIDPHTGHSPDGMFKLERVECLASCGSAPMMQVDEHFYELLTPQKIDEILDGFKSGRPLPTPRPEADQWTWNRVS